MESVSKIFESIQNSDGPDSSDAFNTQMLPGSKNIWIGKSILGNPALLIQARTKVDAPSIILENLSIQHNLKCKVVRDGTSEELNNISIIKCVSDSVSIRSYFLLIMDCIINSIDLGDPSSQINDVINRFTLLFRAALKPPSKSVQGLWAELFVICFSSDPNFMVTAWHSIPTEKIDFIDTHCRIEVKSTTKQVREHHFSLTQLDQPDSCSIYVASINVDRIGNGASIRDLLGKIKLRLSPTLIPKIDDVLFLTLGSNWMSIELERFDLESAKSSLAFYDGKKVPRVLTPLPIGVSEVHFVSNLSGLNPISESEFELAELMRAVKPM